MGLAASGLDGRQGFYDREHWWENDRFTAAGVREEAQWVWDGLDELLARHGYRREGNTTGRSSPTRIPSSCSAILASLVSLLSHLLGISPCPLWQGTCLAHLRHHPEHGGAPGGIASFRMTAFWGHLPPVRGGTGAILLRSVLRNLRKLGTASRLTSNPEKRPARNMQDVFSAPRGVS